MSVAELKATLTELAAELARARKKLSPTEFAKLHLGIVEEVKAWLAGLSAERRTRDPSPHPRLDAAIQHCDELIGQYRQCLASLLPEQAGRETEAPEVTDDDRNWRVAAGLSSGPPPPERQRRPQLGAGAPVEARRPKSFGATPGKYADLNSGASAASGSEGFCAARAAKSKTGLSVSGGRP